MGTSSYQGSELELFQHARNWKTYFARRLRPHIRGAVLEVGAGIGASTELLLHGEVTRWVCLEPDVSLLASVEEKIRAGKLPELCVARPGSLADLPAGERFDTVLYIDVLEHIEDDRGELEAASRHLRDGGRLVVLAPAFPSLFSPFDEAIGHHRRYTRKSLRAAAPAQLRCEQALYLDSVGLLASIANRSLLRHSMPTLRQVLFWDRVLVPASRLLDPIVLHAVGKSVIAVWKRTG